VGAHTLALNRKRSKIYAFLPRSHRAAVFVDTAHQNTKAKSKGDV
jgi:hypothetical protein